jgi:hypothetical protein
MVDVIEAKANITRLVDPYRSKAERDWSNLGPVILPDELGGSVVVTHYEPMTIHLPGGKFTPDFLHILNDGRLVFCEVKGSKRQKNYRDARSKLRAAACIHPWATWIEARQSRGGWELELINE